MPPSDQPTVPRFDPAALVHELLDRSPVALRLLEAARSCVLDRGISRVTMSDVARRADVSRTTLYRHYPDVEAVLRDLMTRDFGGAVVRAAQGVADRPTARERLVGTLVEACRGLRADELFRKIVDVDPEFLLPYVTARTGVSQRLVLRLAEAGIREGQADGSIRGGDPDLLGRLLLLQAQAMTFSLGVINGEDGRDEADLLALADEAMNAQLAPR
ncbi:TetR/AcrR family transcriptional regulator [Patulibacter sp. SYSU D01012]|uniref:TetR/AcrR family transcriptional regulator n=1 Tax=Patulibacter sp. SYSU D01012 TaxID=2817381 RepID=UPI001B3018E4|nr:TetR/AcrR family transcriptional regulator [Patulibacter sp. SYSU D01012]